MKKYIIMIWRYSIVQNDTILEKIIIETEDIYHTIGEIYCKSLSKIENIRYFEV